MDKGAAKVNSPQRTGQASTKYNSTSVEHRLPGFLVDKDLKFEERNDTDTPTNQSPKSYKTAHEKVLT